MEQITPSSVYGQVAMRMALALALAATLAAVAPSLAQTSPGAPIRIGSLLSVTGGLASVGQPEREGMLVALKVLNARGGINGRPLEIVQEDDASSPDSAVSKINALVFTHKVKAIIGPSGIAQTVAVGGITQKANVPLMAFTGLGPPVEKERTCVFHLTPAQELNARGLLAYARDTDAFDKGFKSFSRSNERSPFREAVPSTTRQSFHKPSRLRTRGLSQHRAPI